jgi:AraC-like DNA-binding protein
MELNDYDIVCLDTAKNLIEKNLHFHYTIQELAKEIGMNEWKLKKGFKQVFGMGPFEYLVNARMEKAKSLLSETKKSLKQIARSLGYKYPNNFITAFEKKFEQSPANFKKQLKLNSNHTNNGFQLSDNLQLQIKR